MIYLLRHGETEWNREERIQGHLDSALTAAGEAQARHMGLALRTLIADFAGWKVVASPLGRARRTAEIAAEAMDLDPATIALDDRLKEIAYGLWEGLTGAEAKRRWAAEWRAHQRDAWNTAPPRGESMAMLVARARAFLDEVEGRKLVVVAHGHLNMALRGSYAGLSPDGVMGLAVPASRTEFYCLHGGRFQTLDARDFHNGQ